VVAAPDRIPYVEFVFKRANPDAEREFADLFARMTELEARPSGSRSRLLTTSEG
jgi:hypothetical protein